MDNAEHRYTKSGDESDAYGRWRKYVRWKAGQIKAIKRRTPQPTDWTDEEWNAMHKGCPPEFLRGEGRHG